MQAIGISISRDCWQAWRADFVTMLKEHFKPDTNYGEIVSDLSERCSIEMRKKKTLARKLQLSRKKYRYLLKRHNNHVTELEAMRDKLQRLMPIRSTNRVFNKIPAFRRVSITLKRTPSNIAACKVGVGLGFDVHGTAAWDLVDTGVWGKRKEGSQC